MRRRACADGYHEWRARLPARGAQSASELKLHAARDFFYAVMFCTLPWVAWHGRWVLVLVSVLIAEIILTLTDFVVEITVRRPRIPPPTAGRRGPTMLLLTRSINRDMVLVCCFAGAAAGAQTQDAQLMAPIRQFIDSFNKGDMAGASATHAAEADLTIIDEVPPYLWQGPQAFKAWSADLASDAKKRGITESAVTISAPTRTEADGNQAYVVLIHG